MESKRLGRSNQPDHVKAHIGRERARTLSVPLAGDAPGPRVSGRSPARPRSSRPAGDREVLSARPSGSVFGPNHAAQAFPDSREIVLRLAEPPVLPAPLLLTPGVRQTRVAVRRRRPGPGGDTARRPREMGRRAHGTGHGERTDHTRTTTHAHAGDAHTAVRVRGCVPAISDRPVRRNASMPCSSSVGSSPASRRAAARPGRPPGSWVRTNTVSDRSFTAERARHVRDPTIPTPPSTPRYRGRAGVAPPRRPKAYGSRVSTTGGDGRDLESWTVLDAHHEVVGPIEESAWSTRRATRPGADTAVRARRIGDPSTSQASEPTRTAHRPRNRQQLASQAGHLEAEGENKRRGRIRSSRPWVGRQKGNSCPTKRPHPHPWT